MVYAVAQDARKPRETGNTWFPLVKQRFSSVKILLNSVKIMLKTTTPTYIMLFMMHIECQNSVKIVSK